jgi:SnoaL-like protein
MASEPGTDLELVRSIYAEWERGDFSQTDWADPEIEVEVFDGLTTRTTRGIEEMGRSWGEFLDAWDHLSVEVEEIREVGGNRFLALITNRGRGRISGLAVDEVRVPSANLLWLKDGKVTRLLVHVGRERIFAELGLAADR